MSKIYQQVDSQGYHIGTSSYPEWVGTAGAIDTKAPEYDPEIERAKWDGKKWIIEPIQKDAPGDLD